MSSASPVQEKQRFAILDALRGFALLGICLANFPEFSLFSFLSDSETSAFPTAEADSALRFLSCLFVDGKFYTLFSVLFGIGFSIILGNAKSRGANGYAIFYRRMAILLVIGLCHLFFLWSGDILALYAVIGMLLPLFSRCSNKVLLILSASFLVLPLLVDFFVECLALAPAAFFYNLQWYWCGVFGITEANFASWLATHDTYSAVFQFLVQGAAERMTEFIDGNRYFKVLGLFLFGFYVGRNRIYARVNELKSLLRRVFVVAFSVGFPLSMFYAFSCVSHHPWGLTVHTALYTFSVFPLGLAYLCFFALFYISFPSSRIFSYLASPGRMALSCYIGQTVLGIIIFYGVGFGLGTQFGLSVVLPIAFAVYLLESLICRLWLCYFRYGLIEWIWRMLTYGRWLDIKL